MNKIKEKKDKILKLDRSPLAEDLLKQWEDEAPESLPVEGQLNEGNTTLSGKLEVGAHGHPVTIIVVDEVNGAEMEFNHVHSALVMLEEKRKESAGWLSLIVGKVNKLKPVLEIVANATLDELKKLSGRRD